MSLILNALSPVVDELGAVNAQIAALQARADDLKAQLIADNNGQGGEYVGEKYRAVVSVVQSMKANWKLIAEKAGASQQLIRANSRPSISNRISLYDL